MAIEGLISLLVALLVIGVIVAVVYWITTMLPISQQARNVVMLVVALFVFLWLLQALGIFTMI